MGRHTIKKGLCLPALGEPVQAVESARMTHRVALLAYDYVGLRPTMQVTVGDGERLSCQVKVKQYLAIELPPEVFSVRQWRCTVRSNHNVATFIKELVLELPEGESVPFRPGG